MKPDLYCNRKKVWYILPHEYKDCHSVKVKYTTHSKSTIKYIIYHSMQHFRLTGWMHWNGNLQKYGNMKMLCHFYVSWVLCCWAFSKGLFWCMRPDVLMWIDTGASINSLNVVWYQGWTELPVLWLLLPHSHRFHYY